MPRLTKYSLWLMPTGKLLTRLTQMIEELSRDRQELCFEPHVTLLGTILGSQPDFSSKTRQLASMIKPYDIQLDRVEYLDEFFRSLFVRVKPTGSVLEANRKARLIFQQSQDPEYLPHLSLMYGDFPTAAKEEVLAKIGREFRHRFKVRAIYLCLTEGEPKDWHRVEEFPLNNGE
jgi:2'-5' RNA ligase